MIDGNFWGLGVLPQIAITGPGDATRVWAVLAWDRKRVIAIFGIETFVQGNI